MVVNLVKTMLFFFLICGCQNMSLATLPSTTIATPALTIEVTQTILTAVPPVKTLPIEEIQSLATPINHQEIEVIKTKSHANSVNRTPTVAHELTPIASAAVPTLSLYTPPKFLIAHATYISQTQGNDVVWSQQILTSDQLFQQETTITQTNKPNSSPQWSPRGDMLAYSREDSVGSNIFVFDLIDEVEVQITNTEDFAFNPIWNAEGTFLYFVRGNREIPFQIFKINILSLEETQLSFIESGIIGFDVSHDGKIIVTNSLEPRSGKTRIFKLSEDGTYLELVTNFQYGAAHSARWSPSKQAIAYLSNHLVNVDVEGDELIVIDSNNFERKLTDLSDVGTVYDFNWSSNGKDIFVSTAQGLLLIDSETKQYNLISEYIFVDFDIFQVTR